MKFRKKFIKGLTYASLFGLVMANMTFVHAEENNQQVPIIDNGNLDNHDPGIFVSNTNNLNSPTRTQEEIDKMKEADKKVIEEAYKRDEENKFSKKKSLSDLDNNKPDDLVSVIVQLKGQTASELTNAGNPRVSSMSMSNAVSLIKKDIQTTKTQIMSALSPSISKNSADDYLKFKQEYVNVFKGFSIDNIKNSDIDTIKSLPNVQSVTLQHMYYPQVNQQHELTGIKNLWSGAAVGKPLGYHGEGMLIAIVDTGIDYTHEAFPDPKDMSKARIQTGKFKRVDGSTSLKVVDGYNWADQNADVIPHVEDPNNNTSSHGVHVAGIAAGSGPVVQGVAPEAQLIAEKVFSDHNPGAYTEDIIKGIDHASSLGADVINMSLGSSSSFDTRDPNDPLGISIRNATDEGHIVVVAAGNASNAYSDRSGGVGQTIKIGQTPDLNKIGNPGVYPDSFTVAAANNIVNNHIYQFKFDTSDIDHNLIGQGLDDWSWKDNKDKQYTIMRLGKYGKDSQGNDCLGAPSDYSGLDVKGKIVLVKRGTLNFAQKVENARLAGAAGIIVYNSDPNKSAPDPLGFSSIPFSFISYQDGMALQAALDKKECNGTCGGGIGIGGGGPLSAGTQATAPFVPGTLTFKIQDEQLGSAFPESNPGEPTDFTSWGTTSDLLLKPEVMAPGHAIVSSVRTADTTKHNAYESEDGTSMAAPYVTGSVADVMQALIDKGYKPGTRAFAQLTKNLIMNTSIPSKRDFVNSNNPETRSDYMTEYQPRRQGAGMIRPDLAVQTPVVLTGSDGTGSISLKEIGDTSTFVLTAQNLTKQPVTYKLNGTVMTDVLKDKLKANSDNIRSQYVKDAKLSFDQNQLTIPANSTKRVTVTLSLPDYVKKNQFVEGYIYFTPTDSTLPTLNVPYNGFYGKWDEPQIVDTPDTTNVWTNSGAGTQLLVTAGGMLFAYKDLFGQPTTDAEIALGDKFYSFNPNLFPSIYPLPGLALLRNARDLKIDVVDKDHHLVTHLADDQWVVKNDPYSGSSPVKISPNWVWYAYNQAVPVPDGQYYFAITPTADAPNAKPQPTYYMPMYLDRTAPTMNVLRSADYDEKNKPEVTTSGSYTVKWSMDDGDAGNVDGNVYLAVNGQEPYTNYQKNVIHNSDGTNQLTVSGLNEGLNIITVAPVDKAGNIGEDHNIIVKKTSNDLWIDLSSAALNDNFPSINWEANVKPGDTYSLNFKGVGRTDSLKKVQAVILKDPKGVDKSTIVGKPFDLDLTQSVTQTPYYDVYSEYSIKGKFTVPTDLPKGKYAVMYYCLADGESWTDPNVPTIGIETYVDTDAPTITLSPSRMKAYVENSGDPVSLMLNMAVKDPVGDSHGYNVQYSLDGGTPVPMGSVATYTDAISNKTIRYPVVLSNGDHSIKIQATDGVGNISESSFTVTVASDKVTATVGTTPYVIPVNIAPYKDNRNAAINITDQLTNGIYTPEYYDPAVNGYLVSPFGNNSSGSGNPDLYPILLVGNQQRIASIFYLSQANQFGKNPADVYGFQNQQVGYNDPSSIPQGDSDFPVTMVDYLGHVTTIKLPVHKNPYIPKVKFDNAIIDHKNMDTATFFTYDSTYTVTGSVTAVNDKFFAEWNDLNNRNVSRRYYKNLFDNNSPWSENIVDPKTGAIPDGYENDPGVKKFSLNSGQLHPGPNYFSILGGSTIGSNPSRPLAGIHPLVYNVVIYQLGTSEGADQPLASQAVNNLTFDSFKGENKNQSSLETNLNLPLVDNATHAHYSWSSSNPNIITNDGLVIRPEKDTVVTLTATATVGTANSVKTFDVTVAGKEPKDENATAQDASYITWNVIRGDNTDQANVTGELTLPSRGSNGTRIEWMSDDQKHITNEGKVYTPLFDEDDAHVELVAKITRNSSTEYKTFNLIVLKDSTNKEKTIVLRAFKALESSQLLGENPSELVVTHDLVLPTTIGNDGVNITWMSNNPDIISNDGKLLKRPAVNQYVSLVAKFQLGTARLYQQYYFFVRSQDPTDAGNQAAVIGAKASIVWNLIKKNNTDQNAVKSDLTLPTKGNNDTTISWSSSDQSIISNDGKVNQPTYEAGNRTVTITATITKGNANVTQQFMLTVLHNDQIVGPPVTPPVTPPIPPVLNITINAIGDNDTTISGSANANATIVVKNKDEVIATGKANADGKYEITISKQKAGTVLTVTIKDADGNEKSDSTTVLDRTAPDAPKVNEVGDNDTWLTGTTEAKAKVIVKNSNQTIAIGSADQNGNYRIKIDQQKAGTELSVIAEDAAGNQSKATTIKVLDRTAPNAPKVNAVGDNDTWLTGTAEANAKVIVKIGIHTIATGTADQKGSYRVKISEQKAGTVLSVTAEDTAGNQSKATTIKVLDRTAPNVPKITSFFDKGKNQIKGTAEANSTIVVMIGKKIVAKVKVSSNGSFIVKLPKPGKGKTEYTLYAIDQAGNGSVKVKRSLTVK